MKKDSGFDALSVRYACNMIALRIVHDMILERKKYKKSYITLGGVLEHKTKVMAWISSDIDNWSSKYNESFKRLAPKKKRGKNENT